MSRRKTLAPEQVGRLLRGLIANFQLDRSTLARRGHAETELDPPGRSLAAECGYPDAPSLAAYRQLITRYGIARRVVNVLPDECFAVYPPLYETEEDVDTRFERGWAELNRRLPIFHYLHRADQLSGWGRYGVLLLGIGDGRRLSDPVAGLNPRTGERDPKFRPKKATTLAYLRPFTEEHATIAAVDEDDRSPRFGEPTYYNLHVGNPRGGNLAGTANVRVHWTRVLHLAECLDESNVTTPPRLEPVFNYLLDLRKVAGSSGEMWYKGGFPGFAFETIPELLGESVMDEESVKEQFLEYMEGLKRYLALDGVTAKPLLPQIADPTPHAMLQIQLICATIACPVRIFLGSEAGHLASTQDVGTWNKRVAARQQLYLEPMVIRPLVHRLINAGVLPTPARGDFLIAWHDLNTMSDKDKALVSLQRSQALMQYVSGGVEAVIPVKEYLTLILGLTREEAEAVVRAAKANTAPMTDPLGTQTAEKDADLQIKVAKAAPRPAPAGGGARRPSTKPQGGGRRGAAPRKPAGRPAGNIQRN